MVWSTVPAASGPARHCHEDDAPPMITRFALALMALISALALGACSPARFAGGGPVGAAAAATPQAIPEEPVEAVPSGPVSSEPLPPIGGQPQAVAGGTIARPGTEIAALPPAAAPVPIPAPSARSTLVGGWNARDASGSTCRVQLSSSPALDLYRASAGNCANRDLARVTAWDYRDGEVYLYQSGGTVAARLRTSGGALHGVIAKSGAPLTLTR
jgi:hypothetical protein